MNTNLNNINRKKVKKALIKHKHCEQNTEDDFESLYEVKKNEQIWKKRIRKPIMEIDDLEDISLSKKEKWESYDEINKNDDFEKSYVFIEDSDENFDFNKMVKVNDK